MNLAYAGRPAAARVQIQDAIAYARARGDVVQLGFAFALRGEVMRLEGEMLAAEIDTRTGVELLPPGELGPRFMLRALIESLVEQDRIAEAEDELRRGDLTGELPEMMPSCALLYARARVRIAAGSVALGIDDLMRAGEIAERVGLQDPVSVPWRLAAAEALVSIGSHDQARELVSDQLARAQRTGLPDPIGAALRVRALLENGPQRRETLSGAVALLGKAFSRLEFARALFDLGRAQLEHEPSIARKTLERAAALTGELGAAGLAARVDEVLIGSGGRPRRAARRGARALTPAERRTAQLAAEGMTNREIADTLVLSEKTVGSQLTAAFRKLGIRSRAQLGRALAGSAGSTQLGQR